jgi:hypothetical protein
VGGWLCCTGLSDQERFQCIKCYPVSHILRLVRCLLLWVSEHAHLTALRHKLRSCSLSVALTRCARATRSHATCLHSSVFCDLECSCSSVLTYNCNFVNDLTCRHHDEDHITDHTTASTSCSSSLYYSALTTVSATVNGAMS